jgi:hypothetical protein
MASFAKPTFGSNKESMGAGDYIVKKAKATNCNCVNTNEKNVSFYNFNKYDLNLNLFSKMDLSNVCVIEDMSGNVCPTKIIYNEIPNFYTRYIIDPNGQLFGNTNCGTNRFLTHLVYNPPPIFFR